MWGETVIPAEQVPAEQDPPDADGALSARMREILVPFLDGITFKAGVSSPFNDIRKVRMQVLPADGSKAFLAVCEVNGRSGEVIGLAPRARGTQPALAAADPR